MRTKPKSKSELSRRGLWLTALVCAFVLGLIFFTGQEGQLAPKTAHAAQTKLGDSQFLRVPTVNQNPIPAPTENLQVRRQHLQQQWQQAEQILCQYQQASRYPQHTRPLSEQPDQIYPNQPVSETRAMRKKEGGVEQSVHIQTMQSRVYLAAGESAHLSIAALDAEGKRLAITILRTQAQGISYGQQRAALSTSLAFADDGREPDSQAGDGMFSTQLNPAQSGLAGFHGTIRTTVEYQVGAQAGLAFFDVIYSPELPALWAGAPREAIENGDLRFYLPLDVRMPGRYVVQARVDDARGLPFAMLSFNQELAQGRSQVVFSLAGKLVRDTNPVFPLKLRDIDGYLLRENVDPDRYLLPRQEGQVAHSKRYALTGFSDEAWTSEEKTRYLNEYSKDLALAQAAWLDAEPEQARKAYPPSACSDKQKLAKL